MKQTIQNTAQALANKLTKNYTFEELIKHRSIAEKNLYEILGQYPGGGVGFKIWHKNWPEDRYILVKDVQFKGLRSGKYIGLEYVKNRPKYDAPTKLRNCNKRGLWRYDINGAQITTENGLYYNTESLKLHYKQNCYQQKQLKKQEQQKQQ